VSPYESNANNGQQAPPPAELMVGVEPGFAEKVRVDVRHMSNKNYQAPVRPFFASPIAKAKF